MSYISCIVASCKTRRKPNTDKSFAVKCFSFPKDPVLKKEWLDLCRVKELEQAKDSNRKVCIKHFKEDDFVDGLKARLLNLQPTRLKKDAVPSLYLTRESENDDNAKNIEILKQEEMFEKLVEEATKKENKAMKPQYNGGGSIEYLSKLIPIAPKAETPQGIKANDPTVTPQGIEKGPMIAPKGPSERRQYSKFLEHTTVMIKPKVKENLSDPRLKILQHDNAIYKKRISILLDNQNKLITRIKHLEETIKDEKEDFVDKVKEAFAHVLTPNQIDLILGKKTRVWWTDMEYSKAYTLHHFSKQAYGYVRDTLNYPLPYFTTLQQWAAKLGAEMPDNDEDEIKPPLPKRFRLKLEEMKKENYDNKENYARKCAKPNNIKPNDNEFICGTKPESENDHHNTDGGSKRNKQSDGECIHIEVDKKDELGDEMYEQVDYIDDDDGPDDISDGEVHNDVDKCTDDANVIKKYYFVTEIDEQSDEFFEELIIDNVSDHEVIDNLNPDKSNEEDNG